MNKEIIVISAVWCPSCLILKKQLKKLHEEFNYEYKMFDYDLDDDEVSKYNVGDKLPVIIYGDRRLVGEHDYEDLVNFLKSGEKK